MRWQCVLFDNANERTVSAEADGAEDAVLAAWREMLAEHCDDPSQMGVEDLYLTFPEDGNLELRASVQVPTPGVDLFVVVDGDRMVTPLGLLRRMT